MARVEKAATTRANDRTNNDSIESRDAVTSRRSNEALANASSSSHHLHRHRHRNRLDDDDAVDEDDEDEDDDDDAFERSPMVVFATLVLTFVTRALATCVAAAAAATYPARACAPRRATDWLARRAFDVGYAVYASRVGRYVHGKMVEASREDSAHSKAETARVIGGCVVATTPFLRDNYSYVVVDAETREAAAIDPADPEATMRAVKRLGARLTTVLTTHKHHDHAGGNAELVERARREENGGVELRVYGHAMDTCHGANAEARDGDIVRVGTGTRFLIAHVPCHTRGHVVYAVLGAEADDERDARGTTTLSNAVAAFTGDAIINGSVGAFFHGGSKDCYDNLHSRLADVPDDCLVYSGHEYMDTNLRFAKAIDPEDEITANCFYAVLLHRRQNMSTMPSSFRVERRLNPFFRCRDRAYLRTLLKSKHAFALRRKRPWWHRYFGPTAAQHRANVKKRVESCALARALAANEGEGGDAQTATKDECVQGIETVKDLMSDVFSVMDPQTGDAHERRMFAQYLKHAHASGMTHVVVSQLIAPEV